MNPPALPSRQASDRSSARTLTEKAGKAARVGVLCVGLGAAALAFAAVGLERGSSPTTLAAAMGLLSVAVGTVALSEAARGLIENTTERTAHEARVVALLEQLIAAVSQPVVDPAVAARRAAVAGIRQAIEEGRWERLERRLGAFASDFPGAAELSALEDEAAKGRQAAADDLRARLQAARSVSDPDGVIDARNALRGLLAADMFAALDRELVQWLMHLIQKRMRAGTFHADIALLAQRVAMTFADTPEGASIRASLPILRRSGGLCPRCGQPYAGVDDACPKCLGAPAATTQEVPSAEQIGSAASDGSGSQADENESDASPFGPSANGEPS
jgi:hypothetical protein